MTSKSFINSFLNDVKPYPLSSHDAWDHKNKPVLKLDWNESTIKPSPRVISTVIAAVGEHNLSWYPDTNNKKLRQKIADYAGVPSCNVQYYSSSDSAHEIIARTFSQQQHSVLIITPTYDNFRAVIETTGAKIARYNADSDFQIDIDQLNAHISSTDYHLVYLANPNNPTGTIITDYDLEKLLKSNEDKLFIIDEAYYEFGGVTLASRISEFNNLIITRTFSKAFGLASFRIGYVIAPRTLINHMDKIRNAKNISLLSQVAAEAALDDFDYTKKYIEDVKLAKEYLKEKLDQLGMKYYCNAGNFILIRLDNDKIEPFIKYLQKNMIYVRSYAHTPNMDEYIRITIGIRAQMERLVAVMEEFFCEK